jgi:hypothetical protein
MSISPEVIQSIASRLFAINVESSRQPPDIPMLQ